MTDEPDEPRDQRHQVSRPKPTGIWSFPWQHEDRLGNQPGLIELQVSYAANTDALLGLPDRFEILATHRGRGAGTKLVLSRQAAAELTEALTEALSWDGQ